MKASTTRCPILIAPRPQVWSAVAPSLLGSLLLCGCTVLSYTAPTGERFIRGSFGANTSIQSLSFEAGSNGLRRVELRGYQNDATQALEAVTEAAIRAAIQGAK